MASDFTRKERDTVNTAWRALESLADQRTSWRIELADMLRHERAGRSLIWAKALMLEAFGEAREMSEKMRGEMPEVLIDYSRGVRFAYLLGFASAREQFTRLGDHGATAASHAAVVRDILHNIWRRGR